MAFYLQRLWEPQDNQGPDKSEVDHEQALRMPSVGPPGLFPMFPYAGVFPETGCTSNERVVLNEARIGGQLRFAQESADDEQLQEQMDALTSAALGFGGGLGMVRSKFTKSGLPRKRPGSVPKEKPLKKQDLSRYAAPRIVDGLHVYSAALLKQRGSAAAISRLREVENLLTSEGVTSQVSANESVRHLYLESIRFPQAAIPNPAKFARNLAERLRNLGVEEARFGSVTFARSSRWHAEEEALVTEQLNDDIRGIIAHQELRKIFPSSAEADLWRP